MSSVKFPGEQACSRSDTHGLCYRESLFITIEYLEGNQFSQGDATALLKTMDGGKTWVKVSYTIE